ncbi:MAG: trigger factor, partial [Patescibacteria group bacterium]
MTQEEAEPYLQEAAERLSKQKQIPGFRPGKAGYEVIKQQFGAMKILEEALEPIVRKSFVEAVLAHNIDTVGSPKIDVEKLAPDNDLVFSAEVTRMPRAKNLPDFRKLSVEAKKITVEEKDIDLAVRDIQRMQTKEVRGESGTTVTPTDKVVVSMNIKKAGVPIEGGQSPNHAIYLNEDYYIPGLKEQVLGMKEGEEKTFMLSFPKDHVQKMLAGNDAEFEIALKEIYRLEPPAIDDAFAKSLGVPDIATLRTTIEKNIRDEKDHEESMRQEREVLELVAKQTQFEELPDLLINEEIRKMIAELQHNVEAQGLEFDVYVQNLKKTLAELKLDMTPQAITRVKVALVMHGIAENEKLEITEKEIDEELDQVAERYEDPETKKQIYTPQYREYAQQILRNRKVIALLKEVMIKS